MGGYLVLYPRVRVWTLVPLGFFLTSIALPAWSMLIYWLLLQALSAVMVLGRESVGGVAFWAHIGGFVAGVLLIKIFARSDYLRAHRRAQWAPRRTGWSR
jgi:membrane associated rhomboid family serine protease